MPAVEWLTDRPTGASAAHRSESEAAALMGSSREHWPVDALGHRPGPQLVVTAALMSGPGSSVLVEHTGSRVRLWSNSATHSLLGVHDAPVTDPVEVARALSVLGLTIAELRPPDGYNAGTVTTPFGRYTVTAAGDLTVLLSDLDETRLMVWPDPVPGSPWHQVREDSRYVGMIPLDLSWRNRFLRLSEAELPPLADAVSLFERIPYEAVVQAVDLSTDLTYTVVATSRWAAEAGFTGDEVYGSIVGVEHWSKAADFDEFMRRINHAAGHGESAGVFQSGDGRERAWSRNNIFNGMPASWMLPSAPTAEGTSSAPALLDPARWIGIGIVTVELGPGGRYLVAAANEAAHASGMVPQGASRRSRQFWDQVGDRLADVQADRGAMVQIEVDGTATAAYLNKIADTRIEIAWLAAARLPESSASSEARGTAAVVTPDGTVVSITERFAAEFGIDPQVAVGRQLSELLAPGPAAVAAELLTAAGVDRHGERVVVLDVDAAARWGYWSAVWLGTDPSDGLDRVGMEILEFGPVTSSPENVMTKDQPTGLYNRSALVAMLRTDQVARYDGVAFLDVYDFRAINDQYGIRAGDHCLRVIADWLSTVAGPGDLLVRPSGDEFVVLASQILTLVAAVERLGWPAVVYDGASIPVRLRMGWSARADHASLAATARAADLALSAAKRNVTGSVLRHVPEMAHSMIRRAEQEQGLRASLDNPDGFTVAYQPIMDVRTGVPVGFEALLRTTTGRNVGPTDLIEAAERLGLAARLFDTALEVAVSRSASVLAGNDAALWLNLSRAQLLDDESVTNLLNALARYQVPHDRVVIEITERVVDEPSMQVAWVLDALRGKGIHFAVDDFGQGASNLAALQQFEVDIVKLDLSLLPRHRDDPRWRLVGAVERMLTSLELAVVAEGVETAVQSQRLVELGIHLQQGYLYGRPVTPDS